MEQVNNHFIGWKVFCTFLLLHVSLASYTSSSSPWPYLQIYPPVNKTDSRTPLYFALMLSFGGDYTSIGALPGVQIALDYINSQPSILPGYTLHYTLTDSQCNRTTAIDSFFREMIPSPIKVGWVGSGCAVATEPTAELTQFYNITQLSCASVSPELFQENKFRSYFQLLSSATLLARGFSGVIRAFKWKRVALITQNELVFVKIMDELKRELSAAGVRFTEKVFASADSISGLGNKPFDPDARIFVWAMYSSHARALACEAHRHGLHYPINQFLTLGWYGDGWLVEPHNTRQLNCTLKERVMTLNYALTVKMLDYNTNTDIVSEGGLTLPDFEEQYMEKLNSPINDELSLDKHLTSSRIFPYSQHCHEAIITLAHALNRTSEDLKVNQTLNREAGQQSGFLEGEVFSLANFTYSNSVVLGRMVHNLNKTNFLGITGNWVRFNKDGVRSVDTIVVHQYRPTGNKGNHNIVKAGIVPVETKTFSYEYDTEERIWPRGIPSDGVPEIVIVTVATTLTVIYCILSVLGICFAAACLVFNFVYREKKIMVLSTMRINYPIGIGSILFYLSIAIAVLPSTRELACSVNCNVIPIITSIAFSLSNGTIVMKMIRLWYISNHPKLSKKRAIKDIHIIVAVVILVALDVLVILFYFLLAGLRQELGAMLIPNRENPSDSIGPTERLIKNFFYVCSVTGPSILFTLLLGFKIFLMIVALILALRTRKVKVFEGLDDSKYIAASVYISNIIAVVTTVSKYSLLAYVNASPAVQGLAQFIGTTIILCLIFVPKMVALYRDPDGDTIVSASGTTQQYTVTSEDELKLESLRQRVKELQSSLKESGVEADQDDEEEPQQMITRVPQDTCSDDTSPDTQSSTYGPDSVASRNFVTEQ